MGPRERCVEGGSSCILVKTMTDGGPGCEPVSNDAAESITRRTMFGDFGGDKADYTLGESISKASSLRKYNFLNYNHDRHSVCCQKDLSAPQD